MDPVDSFNVDIQIKINVSEQYLHRTLRFREFCTQWEKKNSENPTKIPTSNYIFILVIQEEQGKKPTLTEVSSYEYSPIPLVNKQTIVFEARKYAALVSIFLGAEIVVRTSFISVTYPFKYYLQIVKKLDCEGSLWDPTGHFPKVDHFTVFYLILYTLFNPGDKAERHINTTVFQ